MTLLHRINTQDNDPAIHMAIPEELYHDLLARAESCARSLNTEILIRLSESLQREGENTTAHWMRLIFGEN